MYISNFLIKNNINFQTQKTFDDCVYKGKLKFDFYLLDYNMCIEYDGEQHHNFIEYFHKTQQNFEIEQLKDKIKTEYCKNNNIQLIRIPYWEKDNIDEILLNSISLTK